jgi:hypothetical protein
MTNSVTHALTLRNTIKHHMTKYGEPDMNDVLELEQTIEGMSPIECFKYDKQLISLSLRK